MYALVMCLDHKSQKEVKKVWKQLAAESLSHYAYEVREREPHVTLASFDYLDETILKNLSLLTRKTDCLRVKISHIGAFVGAPMITLNIDKSKDLIYFHEQVHQILETIVDKKSLYSPANWLPHITFANRISHDKLEKVFNRCHDFWKLKEVDILSLKVIEIVVDEKLINVVAEFKLKK
ncbi:2'-5' RNA ligase family protein [Streptococcus saliviloxodontae]|uniref:2'-5' RNA ligase family protein n=1 Tax=Streptococcus saliviloxodontae TaxID=1349416 RepID=A0ABS2PLQ0_9STRE|nr:2'-5' RNA ligase family protein [Streptococcus saliviloxodontae]MBM7636365.1 hypothetical protein [Streptococcus saliviloxodontae]